MELHTAVGHLNLLYKAVTYVSIKTAKARFTDIVCSFWVCFLFFRVQSLDVPVEKVNVIHFFVIMCQCLTMTTWRLVTSQECL